MKNIHNIFLIGFSGSGKSTVGTQLAKALNVEFYDTDEIAEHLCEKSITRIFEEDGETVFREIEREIICRLVEKSDCAKVVALGGGAFQDSKVRGMVRASGTVVYIRCSRVVLYRRLKDKTDRPLLNVRPPQGLCKSKLLKDWISTLLAIREKNYRRADIIVSTSNKTSRQTVAQLKAILERKHA